MDAFDLLATRQADLGVSFTVNGVSYSNTGRHFCTAQDRITGPVVYTRSIGQPFDTVANDVLGSLSLMNTRTRPLSGALGQSLKGEEFTFEVFGVANVGLYNENFTHFNDRLTFANGTVDAVTLSNSRYLLTLGSGSTLLGSDMLLEVDFNEGVVQASDFNFVSSSPTIANSNGVIGASVTSGSAAQGVSVTMGSNVERVELTLDGVGEGQTHNSSFFSLIETSIAESNRGLRLEVELVNVASSTMTVIIRSDEPMQKLQWLMRQIFGDVINYSHTPDSIDDQSSDLSNLSYDIVDKFPNSFLGSLPDNSIITWENLNGATEVSFDVTGTLVGGSMVMDEGGRIYSAYFKMWLHSVTEAVTTVPNLVFTPVPDQSPTGSDLGLYVWNNLGSVPIQLDGDFSGSLSVEPNGSSVIISDDGSLVEMGFQYISEPISEDVAKVLRPLSFGSPRNVTPQHVGGVLYEVGETASSVTAVRHKGVPIQIVADQSAFDTAVTNNDIRFYYALIVVPIETIIDGQLRILKGAREYLQISGDVNPDDITCDLTSRYNTFSEMMEYLYFDTGVTLGGVDSLYADELVSVFITEQVKRDEYIKEILSTIDAVRIKRGEQVFIESRLDMPVSQYDHVFDEDVDVMGDIDVGDLLTKYHEYSAIYDVNHTVQTSVVAYRKPGQAVKQTDDRIKYSDYPFNSRVTGSLPRELVLPFTNSVIANKIIGKQTRDGSDQYPVKFYVLNKQWSVEPNQSVQLLTTLLPDGVFVPFDVMEEFGTNRTLLTGVYYVA